MSTAADWRAELERARDELRRLKTAARADKESVQRRQAFAHKLLQAPDLAALFHELGRSLRDSYGLAASSIVLCDPDYDIRHLLMAAGTPADDIPCLILVELLSGFAPQYVALRQPWFGPFCACDHQLALPGFEGPGSVAMIPLTYRGKPMGSLNFGSDDPQRFGRGLAGDCLVHLGVIVSFCIENTLNRARLLRSGFTDVLTGWHDRRYFVLRLKEELARARRDGTRLVCLMLDIDHFKRVNDTWGHTAGDAVLTELANRIDSQVRNSDVAARYGGEAFVVLLPDTDTGAAECVAERIRRAIAAEPVVFAERETGTMTASIGISAATPASDRTELKTLGEALIARADVALYRAKSKGRNRVELELA